MKCIFCKNCRSIISLARDGVSMCSCGASAGQYDRDGRNAWHTGPSLILGVDNAAARALAEGHVTAVALQLGNGPFNRRGQKFRCAKRLWFILCRVKKAVRP